MLGNIIPMWWVVEIWQLITKTWPFFEEKIMKF
jgi:hypothetical protein